MCLAFNSTLFPLTGHPAQDRAGRRRIISESASFISSPSTKGFFPPKKSATVSLRSYLMPFCPWRNLLLYSTRHVIDRKWQNCPDYSSVHECDKRSALTHSSSFPGNPVNCHRYHPIGFQRALVGNPVHPKYLRFCKLLWSLFIIIILPARVRTSLHSWVE